MDRPGSDTRFGNGALSHIAVLRVKPIPRIIRGDDRIDAGLALGCKKESERAENEYGDWGVNI